VPSTDTRSRILSAAVRLFGEQGYAGTSVRDIAESLGLTKAALYYHFPSKETILDALLDPFVTELTQIVALTRGGSRPAAPLIVERLAGLLAGPGSVLCAFVNDPSVVHRKIGEENMLSVFEEIVHCLAGPDPTPIRLIRARCAIGALQSGILGASFSRLRSAAAGEADCGGAQAPVAGWPPPPVIAEDVRCEVVEAALAALGGER
jgi:AcrR family transcriptional regulator